MTLTIKMVGHSNDFLIYSDTKKLMISADSGWVVREFSGSLSFFWGEGHPVKNDVL